MQHVIHPLPVCQLKGDKGMFTYRNSYGEELLFPIFSWFIDIGKEKILIDCPGPAAEMEKYSTAGLKGKDIGSIEKYLHQRGVSPEDITTIILTHLHYDHITGANDFPNARFIIQRQELLFALNPHPLFKKSYRSELFKKLNFEEVQGDTAVLPGIAVLLTPGHSPGAQSVVIDTSKGKAVIAGFCSVKENFFPPEPIHTSFPVIPPGIMTDAIQAYNSVLRVKEAADMVIPLHEKETLSIKTIP